MLPAAGEGRAAGREMAPHSPDPRNCLGVCFLLSRLGPPARLQPLEGRKQRAAFAPDLL